MKLLRMITLMKRRVAASFFCIGAVLGVWAAPKSGGKANTFATPDFAFPQTVEKNASAKFRAALAAGDALTALQAAIQMDVAANLRDSGTFPASIERFDSLAKVLPAPYYALAFMLEARLYADIYSEKPYEYDSRVLPAGELPGDVLAWSRNMFEKKVMELVKSTTLLPSEDKPLADIKPLIVDSEDAIKAGFTVADFLAVRAADILSAFSRGRGNAIPFGAVSEAPGGYSLSSPGGVAMMFLESAIKRHNSDTDMTALAFFCRQKLDMLSGEDYNKYLKECYDRFSSTPYGASFVVTYANSITSAPGGGTAPVEEEIMVEEDAPQTSNEIEREKLRILESYLSRFPDAPRIGLVESAINGLRTAEVNLRFGSLLLPDRMLNLKAEGRNLYDFYVLVYKLPESKANNTTYGYLQTLGRPLHAVPVKVKGNIPDRFNVPVSVPPLKPGVYAFVISSTPDASGFLGQKPKYSVSTARVSGLCAVTLRDGASGNTRICVVSSFNQMPQPGVRVKVWTGSGGRIDKGKTPKLLTTDSGGFVTLPAGRCYYEVATGAGMVSGDVYGGARNEADNKKILRARALTDLSLYHPGDSVRFTAMAWSMEGYEQRAASGVTISAVMRDANGQEIDTLRLVSDSLGRMSASFRIPESGLLGMWSLALSHDGEYPDFTYFQVAEYKAPTFHVTVESGSGGFKAGDTLIFRGRAATYAGMPVANARVNYDVRFMPLWWRVAQDGSYGGETVTDADGNFTITLPTAGLKDTGYEVGNFSLTASVTDGAGETQVAPAVSFSLGEALHISPRIPDKICAGTAPEHLQVNVNDILGHPLARTLYYEVLRDSVCVSKGEFVSPSFIFPSDALPSGAYTVRFSLDSGFRGDGMQTARVVVWRVTDRKPPVRTPLWVPLTEITAPAGASKVKVAVGSAYDDSWILADKCSGEKNLGTEWIRVSDGMAEVSLPVAEGNGLTFINFIGMRDLESRNARVTVTPYARALPLEVKAETFRSAIAPGAREEWRFRFSLGGVPCAGLPAAAVMTDKALNAIEPFTWRFNPQGEVSISPVCYMDLSVGWTKSNSAYHDGGMRRKPVHSFATPEWNLYGYSLYGNGRQIRMRGTRMYKSMAVAADMVKNEMADDADEGYGMSAESYTTGALSEEEVLATVETTDLAIPMEGGADQMLLRATEMPSAFFMPSLITDADGIAAVDFTAPAFVGTWQFQIMGYTPEMKGAVLLLDAVSAKKVMAQLNAPRFVRTGDSLSVSAILYNNSGSPLMLAGRMEFVDPLSRRVLASREFDGRETAPSASRVVTAGISVPTGISALAIRVYAFADGNSDGEQTLVPVLPSSQPVTETEPFYLAPAQEVFEMRLPDFKEEASVTLSYCDNPVWECVTALPAMMDPESVNMLSLSDALFGNAVASSLFARYPRLAEGVCRLAADSALVSPLQRDPQLKNVLLANTPWVRDAASRTLGMQSLVKYADSAEGARAVASVWDKISARQNSDGGWSWCPEMKSSSFVTGRVLHVLASLAAMDALPAGARKAAEAGFRYMDAEFAREWNESGREYVPLAALVDYLYDKSCFKGMGSTAAFRPLENAAMRGLEKKWRDLGVSGKATAAMLLERRGKASLPRVILESLRQFATVSAERGMWFANLEGASSGMCDILATAGVLRAFAMIEPDSPAVDLLRQSLVIAGQTRDWGSSRQAAEAVHAILSSGTSWTEDSPLPKVSLNGRELDLRDVVPVTGSFVIDLDPQTASGARLEVTRRAASPAWGGVVSRYVAPVLDVKAAQVPQLSIEKRVYAVSQQGMERKAGEMLCKGDRVRVTLTIVCDRTLDYVAVTDPRAACLEPVDQLSGYTSSDGVWYYREVRDTQTNLFIPVLVKGTHVINYECTVDREGAYALGVAAAQSQYAPSVAAHSAGELLNVAD